MFSEARTFSYQPEAAISVSYWSLTLFVLFVGIIVQLEAVALSYTAIIITIVFVLIAGTQLIRRKMVISPMNSIVTFRGILPQSDTDIDFHDIQLVTLSKHQMKVQLQFSEKTILMSKKQLSQAAAFLKECQLPVKHQVNN